MRVLMIDDDEKLCSMLKNYLQPFAIELTTAHSPDQGLKRIQQDKPELILLDIMLPGRDGLTLCKEIRAQWSTPIIMLTARGDTADKVLGLELGADDYVAKPFEPRELVARITALHRRAQPGRAKNSERPDTLRFEGLELRSRQRDAVLNGTVVELSHAEFELLWCLATRAGESLDRDAIVHALRGTESDVFSRSVDILISRLRQKLGDDAKAPRFIKTAWGAGYIFVGKPL